MKKYIDYFLNYLQTEKDASPNTIHKYRADLKKLFKYLEVSDINDINLKYKAYAVAKLGAAQGINLLFYRQKD